MNAMSTPPDADDVELVRAVAAGEERALGLLFDRHAPWLLVRLRRRCADPDVVADVLQDTFVAVWTSARRFRGDGDVGAWLWGIGVRRLVSRLRTTRSPATQLWAGEEPLASAEDQALLGVEHGDVGAALRHLSPELRAVVQTTVLDGLTTREAARLLGLPASTVKARLRRAMSSMREDLVSLRPIEEWS
jgi:RNA polymerase sigma-70 factor, ECF subfamily